MVNYLYRCAERHETTTTAPMGEAPAQVRCNCGNQATRVPATPMLNTTSPQQQRAVDTAAASAERPAVVNQVPRAQGAPHQSTDPRHARLPRP